MANNTISIDTVHQKVLALASKEQRGYITPQEFNLFAGQAQLELFENYFHDIKMSRLKPSNNTEQSDELEMLNERISIHKVTNTEITVANGVHTYSTDAYKLTSVHKESTDICEVDNQELRLMLKNSLTTPVATRPVYNRVGPNRIIIYPTGTYATVSDIKCDYFKKPIPPTWGYVVISGKALYNSSTSVDFNLHESEENNLVMRILELSGITLADPNLVQLAMRDKANTKAEKNN
jgi:hypothetical protein